MKQKRSARRVSSIVRANGLYALELRKWDQSLLYIQIKRNKITKWLVE